MTVPLISIVTPNYNHGGYLSAMLDSCLAQSFQNWEIVIADDASTDDSVEVADSYARRHDRIRLLRNRSNQGAIRTVNRALGLARGEFVVMRSADDINLPDYLQTAAGLLREHPEAALFCGDLAYFRQDPGIFQVETLGIGDSPGYYPPKTLVARLGCTPIHGHTVVIKKHLLAESGYFRESHRWYNDWLPYMSWAFRRGVCYSPRPMAGCRLLSGSFGNEGTTDDALKTATVTRILNDLLADYPDVVAAFRDSGAIGFFGATGARVVASDERLQAALAANAPIRRQENGIAGVIDSVLSTHDSFLRRRWREQPPFRIWFYGAGLHTRLLWQLWKRRSLPSPSGILQSETAKDPEFCELPLINIGAVAPPEVDLVVVSSKSYEEAMVAKVAERFPRALVITFWDRSETRLQ